MRRSILMMIVLGLLIGFAGCGSKEVALTADEEAIAQRMEEQEKAMEKLTPEQRQRMEQAQGAINQLMPGAVEPGSEEQSSEEPAVE